MATHYLSRHLVKNESGVPSWGLIVTDAQWPQIVSHSHLPDEARPLIWQAIAMYSGWQRIIGHPGSDGVRCDGRPPGPAS
jgi:hypothetical protein